jgi:hypothetical protein
MNTKTNLKLNKPQRHKELASAPHLTKEINGSATVPHFDGVGAYTPQMTSS